MSSLFFLFAMVAAFWLTAFAVLLKFAGALLLAWWLVLSPMPVVLLLSIAWFYLCVSPLGEAMGLRWD